MKFRFAVAETWRQSLIVAGLFGVGGSAGIGLAEMLGLSAPMLAFAGMVVFGAVARELLISRAVLAEDTLIVWNDGWLGRRIVVPFTQIRSVSVEQQQRLAINTTGGEVFLGPWGILPWHLQTRRRVAFQSAIGSRVRATASGNSQ